MKVKLEDLSREHVWKVADVKSIPQGWRKAVFYDPETELLYGVLLTGPEGFEAEPGHIYLDTFVSLEEFWAICPLSEEDIGISEGMTEEEEEEAIYNAYMEIWWDEFEFPPELL
jgi:hypothetical protein